MSDAVEEDCPVCNASHGAKERFAVAKVAEHVRDKARRDDGHQAWIDGHTQNGTLSEIRVALAEQGRPRS